jgi:DNA-binding MarR family transcriptional regulator
MDRATVVAWLRLMRVYQQVTQAATTQLRDSGLTLAQMDVLAQVGAAEGLAQQELAKHLKVTKGNVSHLVDKLERSGWVVRVHDGRACRLYLTDAGRALRDAVLPAHEALIAQAFSALSADQQRQLVRLLRILDHSLAARACSRQAEQSPDADATGLP